jgi:hypothetical protein
MLCPYQRGLLIIEGPIKEVLLYIIYNFRVFGKLKVATVG